MSDESETPEQPDESCGATIVRLAARYGLTLAECVEFIDEVGEQLPNERSPMEALRRLETKQREAWHVLIDYQANQAKLNDVKMSTRAMALELGYELAAGAGNVATLSREAKVGKATVNRCANVFRSKLGLPPAPGQRSEEGKDNMRKSRKKQLKP